MFRWPSPEPEWQRQNKDRLDREPKSSRQTIESIDDPATRSARARMRCRPSKIKSMADHGEYRPNGLKRHDDFDRLRTIDQIDQKEITAERYHRQDKAQPDNFRSEFFSAIRVLSYLAIAVIIRPPKQ